MRYRIFACLIALEVAILVFMALEGNFTAAHKEPFHLHNQQLVKVFELTDLALWTGARYTRHISQADVFSAFQDGMGALERFPEGTMAPLPVPMRLKASMARKEDDDEPTS